MRAYQARKQIQLTESKNNFDNYYKHRDEFKKHIISIFGENEILDSCIFLTHKKLFPKARMGIFDIDVNYCDSIIEDIRLNSKRLSEILDDISPMNSNPLKYADPKFSINSRFKGVLSLIEFDCYQVGVSFNKLLSKFNGKKFELDGSNFNFEHYNKVTVFCGFLTSRLETMFSFDENYQVLNMRKRK